MGQRPKDLTPHTSPQHYWGAELRTWRVQRGLSLDELGRRIHRDRSYLAKIERGERSAHVDLVQDCDAALDAAGALVRLHKLVIADGAQATTTPLVEGPHGANQAPHVANQADLIVQGAGLQAPWEVGEMGEDITIPARAPDGKVILVSVPRRLLLKGLGGVAIGLTAGSAVRGALTPRVAPEVSLTHFSQMRQTLADSDNLFGPRQVIPAVQQQLSLMQELDQPLQDATRRDWMRVQTEFADLAGWLYQDSGDHHAARYWMDRSLEWSYQTGDPDDVVFMLTRKSQLALDMRNPAEAISMAEAAMRMSRPRSRLAAISATFAGHGYALSGDGTNSARVYDKARELFSGADPDQSPWGQFFDDSYITVWQAGSRAILGEYRAAAEEYQNAISTLPPGFRRDSGLYLAREAMAYAGSGELEQATNVGLQALTIGVETGSGRILTELGSLNNALNQWRTPHVNQFRDALADALPRQIEPYTPTAGVSE